MEDEKSVKNRFRVLLGRKPKPRDRDSSGSRNASARASLHDLAIRHESGASQFEDSFASKEVPDLALALDASDSVVNPTPKAAAAKDAKTRLQPAVDPPVGAKKTAEDVSVWDKAYDSLWEENQPLVEEYEQLLSRILRAEQGKGHIAIEVEDTCNPPTEIPRHDVVARRAKLKRVTELGLKHMETKQIRTTVLGHEIVLQDVVGQVAGVVAWGEDYIKDAAKDLPYASVVVAGVSLLLPLLKNPSVVEEASRVGFTYVTSQMRYYATMEPLLLAEELGDDLREDLEERLKDLYKVIIDFQIQTILRFYRSRTKNYFRGTVNYDEWDTKSAAIQDKDKELYSKFEQAMRVSTFQGVMEAAKQAAKSREALESLIAAMQRQTEVSKEQLGVERAQLSELEKIRQQFRQEREDKGKEEQEKEEKEEQKKNQECLVALRTTIPRKDKRRIEGDKGGLLHESYCWILENADFNRWRTEENRPLLWIKGDPGKGKTMLMCGVANELTKVKPKSTALSFFFCQATDSRINSATSVLRGLLYMLVEERPELIEHVRSRYDEEGKKLFEDINVWGTLCDIIDDILNDPRLPRAFILIDALDECTVGLASLLELIAEKSSTYSHVKWLVSSRNWDSIAKDLGDAGNSRLSLELNELSISAAVQAFIRAKSDWLSTRNRYKPEVKAAVQDYLAANANDTFLWAALVCQELASVPGRKVQQRLTTVAFPPGLDALYEQLIKNLIASDDGEECKAVLAVVCVVYRPVTLREMPSLVSMLSDAVDEEDLIEIIELCRSFLTLREHTVSLIHQSAKDYLMEKAFDTIFPLGMTNVHRDIFSTSLESMNQTLKRDIYNLQHPGFENIIVLRPADDPLVPVEYACVFWIEHLLCAIRDDNEEKLQAGDLVDKFLGTKYLYWLEAVSLLNSIPEAVDSLLELRDFLCEKAVGSPLELQQATPSLEHRLQDACRFAQDYSSVIAKAPLQVYLSALIFSPSSSITRLSFASEEPQWIIRKPSVPEQWSASLQVLYDRSGSRSVGWLRHSTQLGCYTCDDKVKIWELKTGRCISTFQMSESADSPVTWCNDGRYAVSLADPDLPVEIWDSMTNRCLVKLEESQGLTGLSLQWSPNMRLIASLVAVEFESLNFVAWDSVTGKRLLITPCELNQEAFAWSPCSAKIALLGALRGIDIYNLVDDEPLASLHDSSIASLAWSGEGSYIATGHWSTEIKIWDAASLQLTATRYSDGPMRKLAWSPDSSRLATGSQAGAIQVWSREDFACLCVLNAAIDEFMEYSMAWSSDGNRLAVCCGDETIKIWDTTVPYHKQDEGGVALRPAPFEPHSVSWSPDERLVAVLGDGTVDLWDCIAARCLSATLPFTFDTLSWSHDARHFAVVSGRSVIVYEAATLDDVCQSQISDDDETDYGCAMAWSPDLQIPRLAMVHKGTLWVLNYMTGDHDAIIKIQDDRDINLHFNESNPNLLHITGFETINLTGVSMGGSPPPILLGPTPAQKLPPLSEYHTNVRDHWIFHKYLPLIWLPQGYRPGRVYDIRGSSMAIVTDSGKLIIFQFSEHITDFLLKTKTS